MKIHERTIPVAQAYNEASLWLIKWASMHGLTYGEIVKFHARELADHAKYMIRSERHPDDPDAKGDEA